MRRGLVVSIAMLAACRGAHAPDTRLDADAASVAAASASAMADAAPHEAPAPSVPSDLPRIAVVLDDARLAAARERERARDYAGAARAIEDALRAQPPADACAWRYVMARMLALSGNGAAAAAAFDRVASPDADAGAACALAPYASLRAAQSYVELGRYDDAIARARAVGEEIVARDEAKLVLAEASSAKGDRAAAAVIWRAAIAASPNGARWIDTAARLAAALLDGVDGAPEARAREAFDLATRVVVEAPRYADSSGARASRSRAAALLKIADALAVAERARQAQAWLDGGDKDKALAAADALLASLPKPHQGAEACRAASVRAQAMPRAKNPADAWGEAIAACTDEPLAHALYFGGKASASARRFDEAMQRFAKVEQLYPKHRFADDARFHAAIAAQDNGDEPRFVAMMSSIPDLYPDGDMKIEALFRVAFVRFARGEYEAAKAPLDRSMTLDDGDRFWGTAGRASYFRARVAQLTGDAADAKKRYAAIVAHDPLAYYMTQAYARLAVLDAAAAKSALASASASEAPSTFFSREHPELTSAAAVRAIDLLAVGEIDVARRELHAAGVLGDRVDAELVWAAAYMFDRAGAPEIGHGFARSRLQDFLAHYPTGKWRVAWEVAFPRAFDAIVAKATETTGTPAPLTWAIMREESGFRATIRSHANAVGLMQLLPSTAREVAKGTTIVADDASLERPEVSIPLGAKLLGSLRRSFAANPALAIAAYNSGTGNVRKWVDARGASEFDVWVEQIPFEETRGYVKRVLASEAAYAFLYARAALDEVLAIPTNVRRSGG
jgi:soluble lytic murein transglycosylase